MGRRGAPMGPRCLGAARGPGRSGPDFEWKGSALGPGGVWPRAREAETKDQAPVLGHVPPVGQPSVETLAE